MIDFANYQDKEELKLLWSECFSDTSEFIDRYFDTMFEPNDVIVIRNNCKIVAMATLHRVIYVKKGKEKPCGYLYAVGVKPQYRGQGYFKKLMAFAKKEAKTRGYAGIVTVPATESLFSLYKKMGYKIFSAFSLFKTEGDCEQETERFPFVECSKQEFIKLRQEYLNTHKSYIKLNEKQLGFVYDYIGEDNIFTTTIDKDKKYAICEKNNGLIIVKEHNFTQCKAAKLGRSIGAQYNLSCVNIKLDDIKKSANKTPYSMAISFGFNRLKGYTNLMFD